MGSSDVSLRTRHAAQKSPRTAVLALFACIGALAVGSMARAVHLGSWAALGLVAVVLSGLTLAGVARRPAAPPPPPRPLARKTTSGLVVVHDPDGLTVVLPRATYAEADVIRHARLLRLALRPAGEVSR